MKVLWFTNTPCGSIRRHTGKVIIGGWLISLEAELKKHTEIDLNVAYISSVDETPFNYDRVHYIPIYENIGQANGLWRILKRHDNIETKNKRLLPLLLKAIEIVKPDLIHVHGTEERFGLIADYRKDIPIAYSIQGVLSPIDEKYFAGLPLDFVLKKENILNRLRGISIKNNIKNIQERSKRESHYLQNARYILGRTFWDRRVCLLFNPNMKYYQAEELMRVDFYHTEWKIPSTDRFTIISTISGAIYKGYETIIHTAYLLKQYADFDFEWRIVGYNADNPAVKMSEYYKGLKSSDCNIKLLGKCDAPTLIKELLSSHVYCHASHIENSPNSVCEALLIGIPTIASFAGGTATLTKGDESEALLYQDGDPYVLAGSIVDIHNNYTSFIKKGKKARQSALYRHNTKRVSDSYVKIYKDIIDDFNKEK